MAAASSAEKEGSKEVDDEFDEFEDEVEDGVLGRELCLQCGQAYEAGEEQVLALCTKNHCQVLHRKCYDEWKDGRRRPKTDKVRYPFFKCHYPVPGTGGKRCTAAFEPFRGFAPYSRGTFARNIDLLYGNARSTYVGHCR